MSLEALTRVHLQTACAYWFRLAFQEVYNAPSYEWGELIREPWYCWAIRSRLRPIKRVARTITQHRDGILRWFDTKIANGLIGHQQPCSGRQGQSAWLSLRNHFAITYLTVGKIDLKLAT
jgi:transposase